MIPLELKLALSPALGIPVEELIVESVNNGLINQTYKISSPDKAAAWVLQQINTSIFKVPSDLGENYQALYKYSLEHKDQLRIPSPVLFPGDRSIFSDSQGSSWRSMQWIPGTCTIEKVSSLEQVKNVAETFALFTLALSSGFNASELKITLPQFHDLSYRYKQFEEALATASPERLAAAGTLILEMKNRIRYCKIFDHIRQHPESFPLRVMHHDAKISNILFEEASGKVWGPIDMDTVMPGYFFSDLGDMIRSLAGSEDEHSTNAEGMIIREDIYETLVNTYTEVMAGIWTTEEKKLKHSCGLLLIYMQTLRFLADHLNGDIYYQVSYSGQNLERSKNQFQLLVCLENYLAKKHQFSL